MPGTEVIHDAKPLPSIEKEAVDLIEELLLMTDERDDSIPLTDWLPDEWVDRAVALHDRAWADPATAHTCPRCAHRPHEPGECSARYFVNASASDPCLCEVEPPVGGWPDPATAHEVKE